MTWLTWRQFRAQAWITAAVLAVFAVALAVTGRHLAHLYAVSGLPTCTGNCDDLMRTFANQARHGTTGFLYWSGLAVMSVLPGLIGIFWGAPLLARELETGTYRLVWNQSVTRTRWLGVKLAGLALVSMATAGLFSLAVSWWAGPLDKADMPRLLPQIFVARGIVPIGYAAFAFVLGVTAGMLIRRTVPAMALTLAVFVVVQVVMPLWVRPHLIPPVVRTVALDTTNTSELSLTPGGQMTVKGAANQRGAWVLDNRSLTQDGKEFTGPADPQACGQNTGPRTCLAWIDTLHLRQVLTYQPAKRFWPLQWIETGVFLGLSALLSWFCVWWVRRRLA